MRRVFILLLAFTTVFTACQAQYDNALFKNASSRPKNLSDSALLDLVQKQTFKYFWDFAHPVSGLARERSNENFGYGAETTTIGGTGFGIMSVIVATERKWIGRDTAAKFMLKMINFLL